ELVLDIVAHARVYQGGGNEVYGENLRDKLLTAAQASLSRMYPRFAEGDHGAWEQAIRRAREGSDQPFAVVDWSGPTEAHPVSRAVLEKVGAGARGSEVRKALKSGE